MQLFLYCPQIDHTCWFFVADKRMCEQWAPFWSVLVVACKINFNFLSLNSIFSSSVLSVKMSEFALFIWVNDKPVQGSVLNMINIIEPRCDLKDYKVGQKVRVKFRGFGDHEAVIGMISGKFFLKFIFILATQTPLKLHWVWSRKGEHVVLTS